MSSVSEAEHVAPEVYEGGRPTPKSDLWAVGCNLYQLLSGLTPIGDRTVMGMKFQQLKCGSYSIPKVNFNCVPAKLLRQLLTYEPESRLDAQQTLQHEFFVAGKYFFNDIKVCII